MYTNTFHKGNLGKYENDIKSKNGSRVLGLLMYPNTKWMLAKDQNEALRRE